MHSPQRRRTASSREQRIAKLTRSEARPYDPRTRTQKRTRSRTTLGPCLIPLEGQGSARARTRRERAPHTAAAPPRIRIRAMGPGGTEPRLPRTDDDRRRVCLSSAVGADRVVPQPCLPLPFRPPSSQARAPAGTKIKTERKETRCSRSFYVLHPLSLVSLTLRLVPLSSGSSRGTGASKDERIGEREKGR